MRIVMNRRLCRSMERAAMRIEPIIYRSEAVLLIRRIAETNGPTELAAGEWMILVDAARAGRFPFRLENRLRAAHARTPLDI